MHTGKYGFPYIYYKEKLQTNGRNSWANLRNFGSQGIFRSCWFVERVITLLCWERAAIWYTSLHDKYSTSCVNDRRTVSWHFRIHVLQFATWIRRQAKKVSSWDLFTVNYTDTCAAELVNAFWFQIFADEREGEMCANAVGCRMRRRLCQYCRLVRQMQFAVGHKKGEMVCSQFRNLYASSIYFTLTDSEG